MYTHDKKLKLLTVLLFGSITFGFSQNIRVSGTVTSNEDKQTIPGVNVVVTGTTTGVQTNLDGHYSIEVPPDTKSLSFSFMGYVTQQITVANKTNIDVVLVMDKKMLDEVVAVGYGVQSKKEVTGAISSIKGEAIKDMPVQSFEQTLAGRATGVNITMPNGVLNNPPVIRIRGTNSISTSSSPLIIIDGIPMFNEYKANSFAANNPLGDINPADIESIDILKDASATAIYGSRAANGVVIVTTKKGKLGKAKISYSSWIGLTQAFHLPKLLNASQYMTIKNEGRKNANLPDAFFPSYNADGSLVDTRWYDYTYRTGVAHSNAINISGATPETSYYFSLGYTSQDGFIRKNKFDRTAVRFNIEQKVTSRLKVGANINYTKNFNSAPNTGSLPGDGFGIAGLGRLAFALPPNISPYNLDGSYNISTSTNSIGVGANVGVPINYYNPVALLDFNKFTSESNHIMATTFAELQILNGLSFKTTYSMDHNNIESFSFQSNKHGDAVNSNGSVSEIQLKLKKIDWTNTLLFQKTIQEKHSITLLGGMEQLYSTNDSWGGTRQNIADDFFTTYQGNFLTNNPPTTTMNSQTENVFLSYFGRATYDYNKKYFITASLRRDGFSGLSKGNKFGNFGGASLGWSVSEENFYKNLAISKVINSFKLRTSYGKVGNMNIPDFGSLTLYTSDLYANVNTITYYQAGNALLKWETSVKQDIGFNLNFLKDRLQLEASYFKNDINGLILNSPQAPSKGMPNNRILQNIGSMYNKGVEMSLLSTNIDKKNFVWSSNINYSYIMNEVTALAAGNSDIVGTTSNTERTNITRVGYAVGCIYAIKTAGVNPDNGQRIFINKNGEYVQYSHIVPAGKSKWTYLDGRAAPAISADDAVIIGTAMPKWFGGFNNTFTYKNMIDLNIGITFSGGNYIYNGSKAGMRDQRFWNNEEEVMNRWTYAGQKTDIPRVVYGDNVSNGSTFAISENVEKGDFLKFKTISLGYKFGQNFLAKTKLSSLRVYVQVTNIYTLTKYSGSDPEVSVNGGSNIAPGVDRNSVPQARTYTFGINLDL